MVQNLIFLGFFLFLLFNFNFIVFLISINFAFDLISFGLILLSFWICALILISRSSIYFLNKNYYYFLFNVLFLMFLLFLTFSCMNLFLFYLFFERRLIPTLFLILG